MADCEPSCVLPKPHIGPCGHPLPELPGVRQRSTKLYRAVSRLKRGDARQTAVDLRSERVDRRGAVALSRSLATSTVLQELILVDNAVGNEGAQALSRALMTNESLTALYLNSNGIGDIGALALGTMLQNNSTLLRLNLSCNPIGDQGAHSLSFGLRKNRALKALMLGGASEGPVIGDVGAEALSQALRGGSNRVLELLWLTRCAVTDAGADALIRADSVAQIWLADSQITPPMIKKWLRAMGAKAKRLNAIIAPENALAAESAKQTAARRTVVADALNSGAGTGRSPARSQRKLWESSSSDGDSSSDKDDDGFSANLRFADHGPIVRRREREGRGPAAPPAPAVRPVGVPLGGQLDGRGGGRARGTAVAPKGLVALPVERPQAGLASLAELSDAPAEPDARGGRPRATMVAPKGLVALPVERPQSGLASLSELSDAPAEPDARGGRPRATMVAPNGLVALPVERPQAGLASLSELSDAPAEPDARGGRPRATMVGPGRADAPAEHGRPRNTLQFHRPGGALTALDEDEPAPSAPAPAATAGRAGGRARATMVMPKGLVALPIEKPSVSLVELEAGPAPGARDAGGGAMVSLADLRD